MGAVHGDSGHSRSGEITMYRQSRARQDRRGQSMRKPGMGWLRSGKIEVGLATLVVLLSAVCPAAGQNEDGPPSAAVVQNGIRITPGPKHDTGAKR